MLIPKLRTALSLPAREKSWLLPLFLVSAGARAASLLVPFRMIAIRLGRRHGNVLLSPLATEGQIALARRIGALAASVAGCTPWQSRCLVRAIMVKSLLNLYGIPYVAYLGVAKAASKGEPAQGGSRTALIAHAWVVVGPLVVSGAAGCNAYSVVSTFVSPLLMQDTVRAPSPRSGIARPRRALAAAFDP